MQVGVQKEKEIDEREKEKENDVAALRTTFREPYSVLEVPDVPEEALAALTTGALVTWVPLHNAPSL